MDKKRLLSIARGEEPADLVLKNASIIDVFTKSVIKGDLAIADGTIIGIGSYRSKEEIDLNFKYVSPGFIDAHVHIESSMTVPTQYAKAVIPRGTTSIIADCHEIANVSGTKGIDFMLESAKRTPLEIYMMIPSCVPATPFETSGARLYADDIFKYVSNPVVKGLGEMMDYPGAISGDQEVLKKIDLFKSGTIDGHAPEVKNHDLNAYVLSGVQTDHECVEPNELIEKVRRGMYIHLREGSQTKNILDLLPALNQKMYGRILLCSDDLHPSDILNVGHIDHSINILINEGIDAIEAIAMATLNAAQCYKIPDIGAIAPGYKANLVVFDSLKHVRVEQVMIHGEMVYKDNGITFESNDYIDKALMDSVHVPLESIDLSMKLQSDFVWVIGLIKNNIVTKKLKEKVVLDNGVFNPKNNPDLLKLCVIERHHNTGKIGKAIVKGYGLRNAAIAMTIAHDSHNLITISDNDEDMFAVIKVIKEIGGGIVLVSNQEVIASLPLEIGGLMSVESADFVANQLSILNDRIREFGVKEEVEDPFLQLAFLSLPVIPELKLTDKGLFDVKAFKSINIEIEESS